jgi:hypothetical protein
MEKKNILSLIDAENVLNMIEEVEKIKIYEPKEQKYEVELPKSYQNNKKTVSKEVFKAETVRQKN